MRRRFINQPAAVFLVVILWKLVLLLATAQPVPFGDAFFYDGAVVNLRNGGIYANPSLELVLPISATKVFSAYPPLYQLVLCGWMALFGAGALAAIWFQFILFVGYGLGLLAIFSHLKLPAFFINLGCLFLFGITYHDRPDGLALALGIWAIFFWLRALDPPSNSTWDGWAWGAVGLNTLALIASLQWGLLFLGWAAVLVVLLSWRQRKFFPGGLLIIAGAIPLLLGFYVKSQQSEIWAGFQEHVKESPTLLGWRAADAGILFRSQLLKLARYTPAIFLATLCFGGLLICTRRVWREWLGSPRTVFLLGAMLVTGLVVVASTAMLAMHVHGIGYLQIILVTGTTAWLEQAGVSARIRKLLHWGFLGLALLVGIRAIGMSTWGMVTARDVNYATAIARVHGVLEKTPAHSTVVASAAFLYEANSFQSLRALHLDWLASYQQPRDTYVSLTKAKPQLLVLTQFDWYRNCEPVVARLAEQSNLVQVTVQNAARIRPPDAHPQYQKVLQNISWAPVIVELQWQTNAVAISKPHVP